MMQPPHRTTGPGCRALAALFGIAFLLVPPAAAGEEPLSLDEIEIQGERLVPQAVYIVGGAEADSMAAAAAGDYLALLSPAGDRVPLALVIADTRSN
jgi:hypothetical protein